MIVLVYTFQDVLNTCTAKSLTDSCCVIVHVTAFIEHTVNMHPHNVTSQVGCGSAFDWVECCLPLQLVVSSTGCRDDGIKRAGDDCTF
eukprot:m.327941 g.327941  ORF g.327941 m.327941 type:complete len:88 (-) comp16028_c2_seq1:497-760(-)